LVRFRLNYEELLEKYGFLEEPVDLRNLVKDEDYYFTPGGVAPTVFSMLRELINQGFISNARWVSLNPNAPSEVLYEGIQIYNIQLPSQYILRYTSFKEGIWREFHGLGKMEAKVEEYKAFVTYNWLCAQKMLELLPSVDLFWVHDFQQLQVGSFLRFSAPVVFRWHIPFRLELVSQKLKTFILRNIENYNAIIVSTKRDLEGLIQAGFKGKAYQLYPYIDPSKWDKVGNAELNRTMAKFNISDEDDVILVVARMDSVKGQDIAVKALALLRKEYPNVKLLLVGNGSFTSSGLGYSKGETWRRNLENLVRELNVKDSVKFTGYVDEEELKCLYTRADVVLLPSRMEGFGLTVVEAWNYMKPVVVSKGAGASELIIEGVNGLTHESGNHEDLYKKLRYIFEHREEALKIGQAGYETAKQCTIAASTERLKTIFESVLKNNN